MILGEPSKRQALFYWSASQCIAICHSCPTTMTARLLRGKQEKDPAHGEPRGATTSHVTLKLVAEPKLNPLPPLGAQPSCLQMSLCRCACKAVVLKSISICLWSDFSAVSLFLTPAPSLINLKTPIYKPARACLLREEEPKRSAHRLGYSAEMQAELLLTQRVITRWNKSAGRVPEMSQKWDQATARALCLQAEGGESQDLREK